MNRAAKKAFPNEEYAILLGLPVPDGFEIKELYFPPGRLNNQNPKFVEIDPEWFKEAFSLSLDLDLWVIGDIHTHCHVKSDIFGDPKTALSEIDWDRIEEMKNMSSGNYHLQGVVRVLKEGDKYSYRTRFWPAVNLPVTVSK